MKKANPLPNGRTDWLFYSALLVHHLYLSLALW